MLPESFSQSDLYKFIEHFYRVKKVYDKNNLAYHNMDHIMDCLQEFTHHLYINISDKERMFDFILAILYHDIVYIPGSPTNEEQSFIYFKDNNPHLNEGNRFEYIQGLIHSTKVPQSYNPYLTNDHKLLHDIDFAGFALDFPDYIKNSEKIWEENKHIVSRLQFIRLRESFLQRVQRSKIFYFKVLLEEKAKENIKKELKMLVDELNQLEDKWDPNSTDQVVTV